MAHTTTLVRAGIIYESLDDAVKRFEEKLDPLVSILGNTIKYATFKKAPEPYLLIVSQQKDKLVGPGIYNVLLTVTSHSISRNEEVADMFEEQTQMPLKTYVPDHIKQRYETHNHTFYAFEKNPEEAMRVLKMLGHKNK